MEMFVAYRERHPPMSKSTKRRHVKWDFECLQTEVSSLERLPAHQVKNLHTSTPSHTHRIKKKKVKVTVSWMFEP